MSKWLEIQVAIAENRCELVLSGPEISKRIEEEGLDENIFTVSKLNYLEINRTSLSRLPCGIGQLHNLSKLSLHSNALTSIPDTIGSLTLLKHLDLSRNAIASLPETINALEQLHTLNLSTNQLSQLPLLSKLTKLTVLDISHNKFDEFPPPLLDRCLLHLSELRARGNGIPQVPFSVANLQSLKVLDVEDNAVKTVAGELGDNPKLKEVFLNGNPLTDRRLFKMVTQCHHKQVIEYIRSNCPREVKTEEDGKGKKKKKKKGKGASDGEANEVDKIVDSIRVLRLKDEVPTVMVSDATKDVRQYIVCCILKDVDLKSDGNFKKFIALQTRLHDNECKKRTVATIATHDLSKVGTVLTYDARPPAGIMIMPLSRPKAVSALELFTQLKKEADAVRKEKKRNTYSGIHKFLHLLDDKPLFPCLVASDGRVISFPPITNSELSKIGPDTTDVFVEVTGTVSLGACKEVMDALIRETIKLEVHDEEVESTHCVMVVQQVKVVNAQHQLKVVYPAQPDLQLQDVKIIRDEEIWPDIKQAEQKGVEAPAQ